MAQTIDDQLSLSPFGPSVVRALHSNVLMGVRNQVPLKESYSHASLGWLQITIRHDPVTFLDLDRIRVHLLNHCGLRELPWRVLR
jgi:hypothetical protein